MRQEEFWGWSGWWASISTSSAAVASRWGARDVRLLDALLLRHHVVEAQEGRTSLRAAVAAYERSMLAYGFEAVRDSRKPDELDEPVHHPVWGAPALAAMRPVFRSVNAVRPMRRRMARSETRLRDRNLHPALAAAGA